MNHAILIPVLVFLLICHPAACAEDSPNADVPKLSVLNHYLGNWSVTYKSEKAPFSGASTSAEWTLDGRFLKETAVLDARFTKPHKLSAMRIVTFDETANLYRSWTFISNGNTSEASGHWDAEANAMTWTSSSTDGVTSVRTEKFEKDGAQSWTVESIDADKRRIGHSEGASIRIDD